MRSRRLRPPGTPPTPVSLVVYDLSRSATIPYGVLTGYMLFVGDVGRPDLHGALGLVCVCAG